jgi:hypothetical protein
MFHLVDESLSSRIENNLIRARQIKDSWFSMGFNIIAFVVVVGGFFFFLYYNFNDKPPPAPQHIEFKPLPWMNAVRNVPGDQQYGQLPETEIRGGIQGSAYRSSASTF